METRSRMSRSLHTNRDFEKLEPYEGKPSRTVLRGEEGSNALDLPDHLFQSSMQTIFVWTEMDSNNVAACQECPARCKWELFPKMHYLSRSSLLK